MEHVATSVWSSKNILKQKNNQRHLMLANKTKKRMGFSRPQKTLKKHDHDNEAIMSQPATKKSKQHEEIQQSITPSCLPTDNQNESNTDVVEAYTDQIITLKSTNKSNFCIDCQKQFSSYQGLHQHKKSDIHTKVIKGRKAKWKIGEEIILNKDYDALISEKGWLCDAVSFFYFCINLY